MSSALLIHSGAVGDFILALRIVEAIRQAAASRVTILGRAAYAPLVSDVEGVDRILDIDAGGFHALFSTDCDIPPGVMQALQHIDLAVNMLGKPQGAVAHQLLRAGVPRVIDIDPRLRKDWPGHVTDQWLADLRGQGIAANPGPPTLHVNDRRRAAARAALDRLTGEPHHLLAVLHPGSGSRSKCWPVEDYLGLAQSLHDENRQTVFLLGPVEADRLPQSDVSRLRQTGPVLSGLELGEVTACLAAADLFVGNDSGISHLAAAVRTDTVAVFGPTDPAHWRPLGDHVRIAYSPPDWPSLGEVLDSCRVCQ